MDGAQGSSPVTHNVYTTGSGATDGGGGSSALHSLLPALLMGQNGNNNGMQHLPALAAAAMAGGGGMRGAHAGMGAAAGGAIGFVLGALLNGNGGGGLFGGNRNNGSTTDNLVTTTELNTALNSQTANMNTNSILQQLAAIAVAIPENEGKVQLAISASQIALMNQATQGQLQNAGTQYALTNNIADARHNINDNIHANALNNANSFAMVNGNAAAGFAAGQLALANVHSSTLQSFGTLSLQGSQQSAAITAAIRDDGDKTRALMTSFNDATLNRIIVTQANEIIELKGDRSIHASGLNITQTVNQAQAQTQAQQQQQAQFNILANIGQQLAGIHQLAAATNQNLIIGNTGAVATGPQTANPVNVNS